MPILISGKQVSSIGQDGEINEIDVGGTQQKMVCIDNVAYIERCFQEGSTLHDEVQISSSPNPFPQI